MRRSRGHASRAAASRRGGAAGGPGNGQSTVGMRLPDDGRQKPLEPPARPVSPRLAPGTGAEEAEEQSSGCGRTPVCGGVGSWDSGSVPSPWWPSPEPAHRDLYV